MQANAEFQNEDWFAMWIDRDLRASYLVCAWRIAAQPKDYYVMAVHRDTKATMRCAQEVGCDEDTKAKWLKMDC